MLDIERFSEVARFARQAVEAGAHFKPPEDLYSTRAGWDRDVDITLTYLFGVEEGRDNTRFLSLDAVGQFFENEKGRPLTRERVRQIVVATISKLWVNSPVSLQIQFSPVERLKQQVAKPRFLISSKEITRKIARDVEADLGYETLVDKYPTHNLFQARSILAPFGIIVPYEPEMQDTNRQRAETKLPRGGKIVPMSSQQEREGKKVLIGVYLNPDTARGLKVKAAQGGTTVSALVGGRVDEYLLFEQVTDLDRWTRGSSDVLLLGNTLQRETSLVSTWRRQLDERCRLRFLIFGSALLETETAMLDPLVFWRLGREPAHSYDVDITIASIRKEVVESLGVLKDLAEYGRRFGGEGSFLEVRLWRKPFLYSAVQVEHNTGEAGIMLEAPAFGEGNTPPRLVMTPRDPLFQRQHSILESVWSDAIPYLAATPGTSR